ncbi:cysteine proteinase [Neolentinus lepideus HHB14362 ss-1]|uniref:Cysteine proteinase n=1 Tax=Neolentinus lepideus HHB14362 ss-1 TaxID=1314782 RepID=A0A165UL98_9AGAM|nr:cysteine proteinase [Neolentinus lepideus HHB14362 ss-1]
MDPYAGRFTNNLNDRRSSNLTARRNLVDFAREIRHATPARSDTGPSSPKRRKLNLNQEPSDIMYPSTKRVPRSRYSEPSEMKRSAISSSAIPSASRSREKSNKPRPKGAVITVMDVDDDEDVGIPVHRGRRAASPSSPDPLNCISMDDSTSEPVHPFDYTEESFTGPSSRPISHAGRSIHLDGPSTGRLQEKIAKRRPEVVDVDADVSDPIEEADAPSWSNGRRTSKATHIVPAGNTKRKAELFEKASEVPQINLRDATKGASKKSAMKPQRQALSIKPISKERPPSSSMSSSKPPSASNPTKPVFRTQKVFNLPLEAWALGCALYSSPAGTLTFSYDTSTHKIAVTSGQMGGLLSVLRQFRVRQEFSSIKYEKNGKTRPIIQLKTIASEKSAKADGFKPGSNQADGLVTFKFDSKPNRWKSTEYQTIITSIRDQLDDEPEILDDPGAKALWSWVEQASQLHLSKAQRNPQMTITVVEAENHSISTTSSRRQSVSQLEADSSTNTELGRASGPPKPRPAYKGPSGSAEPEPPSRRSTRSSLSNRPESPEGDPDELILVYPPTGTGAVNITRSDLWRLKPGEFLNDTLIEFGLKLWLTELRRAEPELADQIHVFSSFFYKKLNTRNREEGYQSVRKWTSRLDFFKKKYVVVPINENLHWYLAIIYEPEHVLVPPTEPPKANTRSQVAEQVDIPEAAPVDRPASPSNTMTSDNASGVSSHTKGDEDAVEEQLLALQPSCSATESEDGKTESLSTEKATEPADDDNAKPTDGDEDALDQPKSSSLTPMESDVEMEEPFKDWDDTVYASTTLNEAEAQKKMGVPPSRFYSSSSKKGKHKAEPTPFFMDIDEAAGEEADQLPSPLEDTTPAENGRPSTYIFTLDSLNAPHKQVINVLTRYLHWEAKDKKGLEETSTAVGIQAHVPLQPNYCDCGLYLLHFAKTFMKDPDRASRLIRSKKKGTDLERRTDWEAQNVGEFRDELSARILSLSEDWKRERAAREEERRKLAAEGGAQDNTITNDSDDDIIVEDVRPAKPKTPRGVKRKERAEDTPAARIR